MVGLAHERVFIAMAKLETDVHRIAAILFRQQRHLKPIGQGKFLRPRLDIRRCRIECFALRDSRATLVAVDHGGNVGRGGNLRPRRSLGGGIVVTDGAVRRFQICPGHVVHIFGRNLLQAVTVQEQ